MNQSAKEIREAIQAGEWALKSLREVDAYLDQARKWGVLDIFGGGFISDLVKHSKIRSASEYMERARNDLRRFQTELYDIAELPNVNFEIGDFLTFADFFFDGFLADFMVQSKINKARETVNRALELTQIMLERLYDQLKEAEPHHSATEIAQPEVSSDSSKI